MDSSETKKLLEEEEDDYEVINPKKVFKDKNWKHAESSSSMPASSSKHAGMGGPQDKLDFAASTKYLRLGEEEPLLGKSASTSSNPDERNQKNKPSSFTKRMRNFYERVVDKMPGKSASTSSKPPETVPLLEKRPDKSASTSSNPGAVREGERNQRNEPRPSVERRSDLSPEEVDHLFEQMRQILYERINKRSIGKRDDPTK